MKKSLHKITMNIQIYPATKILLFHSLPCTLTLPVSLPHPYSSSGVPQHQGVVRILLPKYELKVAIP